MIKWLQENIKILGADNSTESDVILNEDETVDLNNKNGLITSAIMYGRTNGNIFAILIDKITRALISISQLHHEAHEGNAFIVDSENLTLNTNSTLTLSFKTPDTIKKPHLTLDFSALLGCKVEIIEGTTWTQGTGTVTNIINRHRNSSTQSILLENKNQVTFTASNQLIQDVTGLSGGTTIRTLRTFGVKNKISGGGGRDEEEMILKPNTTYTIKLTSTNDSNSATLNLSWYEHTDY